MSAFDNLMLGEVDEIESTCLDGKSFTDADPLKLAGAVMWVTLRKTNGAISWDEFRNTTSMGDIRRFAESEMTDDDDNPLDGS